MRTKTINGIPVRMSFAEEMYELLAEELYPRVKDIRRTPISVHAFLDTRERGSRWTRSAYVDRSGVWRLRAVDMASDSSRTETGRIRLTEPGMREFVDRAAEWFDADLTEVTAK